MFLLLKDKCKLWNFKCIVCCLLTHILNSVSDIVVTIKKQKQRRTLNNLRNKFKTAFLSLRKMTRLDI